MGVLDRLRSRVPGAATVVKAVMLPGGADVEVKGEANYQDALSAICGGKCHDGYQKSVVATLLPEPANKYDKNAVQVYVENRLVGYVNKRDAAQYSPILMEMRRKIDATGACGAVVVGGWDRGSGDEGHFGIWLKLAAPEALRRL